MCFFFRPKLSKLEPYAVWEAWLQDKIEHRTDEFLHACSTYRALYGLVFPTGATSHGQPTSHLIQVLIDLPLASGV